MVIDGILIERKDNFWVARPLVRPTRSFEERIEQISLVDNLRRRGIVCHSVPNSFCGDKRTAAEAIKQGLTRGAPDMVVLLPNCVVALELKRESGVMSDMSGEQEAFLTAYNKAGAQSVLAFGKQAAVTFLAALMDGRVGAHADGQTVGGHPSEDGRGDGGGHGHGASEPVVRSPGHEPPVARRSRTSRGFPGSART